MAEECKKQDSKGVRRAIAYLWIGLHVNMLSKKSRAQKFSQILITTVIWQSVIGEEKMVGPCVNNG